MEHRGSVALFCGDDGSQVVLRQLVPALPSGHASNVRARCCERRRLAAFAAADDEVIESIAIQITPGNAGPELA